MNRIQITYIDNTTWPNPHTYLSILNTFPFPRLSSAISQPPSPLPPWTPPVHLTHELRGNAGVNNDNGGQMLQSSAYGRSLSACLTTSQHNNHTMSSQSQSMLNLDVWCCCIYTITFRSRSCICNRVYWTYSMQSHTHTCSHIIQYVRSLARLIVSCNRSLICTGDQPRPVIARANGFDMRGAYTDKMCDCIIQSVCVCMWLCV